MARKWDYHGTMISNSERQVELWEKEAAVINKNSDYITAYVIYKSKSRIADSRLLKLEALAWDKEFSGVLEYSYKRAVRDIKSWGGDKRFNTAPPTNLTQLQAKLSDIESFLAKPTSTKSGIVKMYKKRADTMSKRYGENIGVEFTWQELANYFESKSYQKGDMAKGSKTMIRALATLKRAFTDKDLKDIKDLNERVDRIDTSGVVKARAKKLLEEGYTYVDLFGRK